MAGMQLTWSIEGETQISRRLKLMADKVKDWTPAFQETADTLKALFSGDVFATQGAVIDEHWSPLKQAYALRKAKLYPGKGLLEASGTMRNSFVSMFNATQAAVWNEAAYFKYHQSNKPRSVLPRRVMMKLANTQREMVVKIFHTYYARSMGTA